MNWIKKGRIHTVETLSPLMNSHAQIPTPLRLHDEVFRIYFSSRTQAGQSRPYYLDYSFGTNRVIHIEKSPLWSLGPPGSFDDCGAMPSSIVKIGDLLYLYYIGWTTRTTVPYHLSIGLAISDDQGATFRRCQGPVMDRSFDEPFFNTAPHVVPCEDGLRMWYVSTTEWRDVEGTLEPVYRIRHARSADGLTWRRDPRPAIDYGFDGEALGRPWVMKTATGFRMWYSSRGSQSFRRSGETAYRIGYAESADGETWIRKDSEAGIGRSSDGWDSDMIAYTSVIELPGRDVMLYNGNGFGRTGFGYAEHARADEA